MAFSNVNDGRTQMNKSLDFMMGNTTDFRSTSPYENEYSKRKKSNLKEFSSFLKDSVEKDLCPYIPLGGALEIDTQPAVYYRQSSANGFVPYSGYLQMVLKTKQQVLGSASPEFVEQHYIDAAKEAGYDVKVRPGEEPVEYVLQKSAGETQVKTHRYYNLEQIENSDFLLAYLSKEFMKYKQERMEYNRSKYGENTYFTNTELKRPSESEKINRFFNIVSSAYKPYGEEVEKGVKPENIAASMLGQILACGKMNVRAQIDPEEKEILKKSLTTVLTEDPWGLAARVKQKDRNGIPWKDIPYGKLNFGDKINYWSEHWSGFIYRELKGNEKAAQEVKKAVTQKPAEKEPSMDIF